MAPAIERTRKHVSTPIFIKPMERIEVVIANNDNEGRIGANFFFEWAVKPYRDSPVLKLL